MTIILNFENDNNTYRDFTCNHKYQKSQNRLLKVCCVPATSAGLPRVSFLFFFFLQWPFTVLIRQTRQAVCVIKQSIFLDVYACNDFTYNIDKCDITCMFLFTFIIKSLTICRCNVVL
jgi:hypothetical protein